MPFPEQPLHEVHIPTGPLPSDVESSSASIRSAFGSLGQSDVPDDLDFVQGGRGLGPCYRQSRRDYPHAEVRVTEVLFLSPDTAAVRIKVRVGAVIDIPEGSSVPNAEYGPFDGRAVRDRATWKIERATFCGLMSYTGVRCPPIPT